MTLAITRTTWFPYVIIISRTDSLMKKTTREWNYSKSSRGVLRIVSCFLLLLVVGPLKEVDKYYLRQMEIVTRMKCSFEAVEELIDLVVSYYTEGKVKEPRMESKMRKVCEYGGVPRGGVRAILCPNCHRFGIHTRVVCPFCEDKIVHLVTGCRDKGCYGKKQFKELCERNEVTLEDAKTWRCTGLDRCSVDEVITVTPLDVIFMLCHTGQDHRIRISKRSEMYLLIRYALENHKSLYLTSAGMDHVFRIMKEDELYGLTHPALEALKSVDHNQGCLNDGLTAFCADDSVESELFGIGRICCYRLSIGGSVQPNPNRTESTPPNDTLQAGGDDTDACSDPKGDSSVKGNSYKYYM